VASSDGKVAANSGRSCRRAEARNFERDVAKARALDDIGTAEIVGIDETSLRRGQNYITVVHDLTAERLLFATEGRDHQTVVDFAADLVAYGGDPERVRQVCQDMIKVIKHVLRDAKAQPTLAPSR
jgi:hypothetical protein